MSINAETGSWRETLERWLSGGAMVQLVVSGRDGQPSFSTVVQISSVDAEIVKAVLFDVPLVSFEFILPLASVSLGLPEAGAALFNKAEFTRRVKGQWVLMLTPHGDFAAFGEFS